MKKLIVIALLFSSIVSQAQEFDIVRDKLFFTEMNAYRASKGLGPLVWNDTIYGMAKHHTTYQFKANDISHAETIKVKGQVMLPTLADRFHHFFPRTRRMNCGENIQGTKGTVVLCKSEPFGKFVKSVLGYEIDTLTKDHVALLYVLWSWVTSPPHNESLLTTECDYAAFAIIMISNKYFEKSLFHDGKPAIRLHEYSTMNFAK